MSKVSFFDIRVFKTFLQFTSAISATFAFILIFVDIDKTCKLGWGIAFAVLFLIIYIALWIIFNRLENINLDIDGSIVSIARRLTVIVYKLSVFLQNHNFLLSLCLLVEA